MVKAFATFAIVKIASRRMTRVTKVMLQEGCSVILCWCIDCRRPVGLDIVQRAYFSVRAGCTKEQFRKSVPPFALMARMSGRVSSPSGERSSMTVYGL